MEGKFKKYGKEISLPIIELRLAISLKEPVKKRKANDTSLEEIMGQLKGSLEGIDLLTTDTLKEVVKEGVPSKLYEKAKKISSRTKEALERIAQCGLLLEKRTRLRSTKSIEKANNQTLDEFKELYDILNGLSKLLG